MKNKLIYLFNQLMFTRDFSKKLDQNFHALTYPERAVYWLFVRPSWTAEKRFFYEACLMIPGQMYAAERKALYDTIVRYRPRHCFEVGTYTGGGSTFFLSSAFQKLGAGKLYTMESSKYLYDKAVGSYKKYLPDMSDFVEFFFGDDVDEFKPVLDGSMGLDCFFLDGSDTSQETVDQYNKFIKYIKQGTILMAHDWGTIKMKDLQPIITADPKWEKVVELTPPTSVGFVCFIRK